jgi:hypothetical protein
MLKSIFQKRYDQLEKQSIVDEKLKELKNECPNVVTDYLLLHRLITRNQQYTLINTNFWNLYNVMEKQLDITDKLLLKFIDQNMTCRRLEKLIIEEIDYIT